MLFSCGRCEALAGIWTGAAVAGGAVPWRDLREWLAAHPEADETAVDEFMRIGGPARVMPRKVRIDHERGGQRLRAGETVFLCIAAANHDAAVFERCRPVLAAMGEKITHVGPQGHGPITKLCNQIAGVLSLQAVVEALLLATKAGVDANKVIEALSGGSAESMRAALDRKSVV